MKRAVTLFICILTLSLMMVRCGTPTQYQQNLRLKYETVLNDFARRTLVEINSIISPQSGKELKYNVDLDNITKVEKNVLAVDVRYDWLARDWASGVPYGTCSLTGTLYVFLPESKVDLTKSKFIPKDYNQHLRAVSTSHSLNKVLDGIIITK